MPFLTRTRIKYDSELEIINDIIEKESLKC